MSEVFILSAARTPMGSFMGSLASRSAPQIGSVAIQAAIERSGIDKGSIEQVLMGNVLTAGIGQAPARQAALGAGLDKSVGAITLGKVCGSGMRTIMDARNAIIAGEWSTVVAGGMESMSQAPHLVERSREGFRLGDATLKDSMIKDGLWDPYGDKHMGNCGETCAKEYGFTREAQDEYALTSYKRAQAASEDGSFTGEIAAVEVPQRKKDPLLFKADEEPFRSPLGKITKLRPAFEKDGTITAANASTINDGAAALVLSSDPEGQAPLARIVAHASIAQDPEWFTTAPIGAAKKALEKASLGVSDIAAWEVNEAFAVVAMAAQRELELDPAKLNPRGGAIALGHPIGCSGARIVTTLAHYLKDHRLRYGCASICIGGGEAAAIVIENLQR